MTEVSTTQEGDWLLTSEEVRSTICLKTCPTTCQLWRRTRSPDASWWVSHANISLCRSSFSFLFWRVLPWVYSHFLIHSSKKLTRHGWLEIESDGLQLSPDSFYRYWLCFIIARWNAVDFIASAVAIVFSVDMTRIGGNMRVCILIRRRLWYFDQLGWMTCLSPINGVNDHGSHLTYPVDRQLMKKMWKSTKILLKLRSIFTDFYWFWQFFRNLLADLMGQLW